MRVAHIQGDKTELKSLPETYKNMPCFDQREESVWNNNGFYVIVYPTITATQKYLSTGKLMGNKYVIDFAEKSTTDLEQEAIQKQQIKKEEIKQKLLDKYFEDQVALTPVTHIDFYDVWVFKPEGYALGKRVQYKAKPFVNNVAGNINAPDKGGWTELKQ